MAVVHYTIYIALTQNAKNSMTLQKLLLKLSQNKTVNVACVAYDGKLTITISEWFTFKNLLKVTIDLNEKIDEKPFKNFI